MANTIPPPVATTKPPFWRNVNVLRVLAQIAAVIVVIVAIRWLFSNLIRNLDAVGIDTDFDFLGDSARFPIRDSSFDPDSSIRLLLLNGIKNTFAAASVGIVIAIVLGTLIGVARLSSNWVVRKLATLYVETLRNIPPLVIIIFFGFAVFTFGRFPLFNPANPPGEVKFPTITGGGFSVAFIVAAAAWAVLAIVVLSRTSRGNERSGSAPLWQPIALLLIGLLVASLFLGGPIRFAAGNSNFMIYSKTRLGFPSIAAGDNRWLFIGLLVVALIVAAFVWRWRTKVNIDTGQPHRRVLYSGGTFLVLAAIAWVALGVTGSFPSVSESGRLIEGGLSTNDGYVSLTIALALYTASHVAEIVRGSILAVPKGQNEAANALALSGFQRYRFVVLPQAARIAVPPIINQFLNLTKNTSLAVAVAYPDITSLVRTAIGNDKPSPQMILILMGIYLSFSLTISLILNIVNRRFQLAGR